MPTQLLVSKQRVASPKIDQTPQRRNSLKTKVLNRILTSRSSSLNVNDDFVNGHIREQAHSGRSSSETIRRTSSNRSSSETARPDTLYRATLGNDDDDDLTSSSNSPDATNTPKPQPPIVTISLDAKSEVAHFDEGRSTCDVWVAITASAKIGQSHKVHAKMPLNIAIILDNSAYTSPTSMKSAVRAIMHMTELLRHEKDRLAILCTSPAQAWKDERTGYTLRPLSAVDAHAVAKDLRLAVNARPDIAPHRLKMERMMSEAFYILANSEDFRRTKGRYCHVVVISTIPQACCGTVTEEAPVPIHVIQPGLIPWPHKLDYTSNIHGHLITETGRGLSFKDKIAEMLCYARGRIFPGAITDVDIKVESMFPGCTIKTIVGQQHFDAIATGQSCTLLAKVMVSSPPKADTKLEAMIEDLEGMLGTRSYGTLRTTVSYRQSLFPDNTTLFTIEDCVVPCRGTDSVWSDPCSRSHAGETSLQLDKKILLTLATSHHPAKIIAVRKMLPVDAVFASAELLSLESGLKAELAYQVATMEKYKIVVDIDAQASSTEMAGTPHAVNGTVTPEPRESPVQHVLSPIRESPDSGKTTIRKDDSTGSEHVENDAARKIWSVMRKDSKSSKDLLMPRSVTMSALGDQNQRVTELRRQALRNKRSIGADTLRSLSLGQRSAEYATPPAPWM